MTRRGRRFFVLLCVMLWLLGTFAQAAPGAGRKLILVLDASRSLYGYTDRGTGQPVPGTDPDGFRFAAIEEFLDYLRRDSANGSKETYEIGGVVYSNDIDASWEPEALDSPKLARTALEEASANAKGQYTNTGAALWEAVRLAGKGSPDAKAAILLVSDGLTDLGTDAAAQAHSEALLSDALQTAKERDIPILTLCLNMSGGADLKEMRNIASEERYFKELNSNRYLSDELFALLTDSIGTDTVAIPEPSDEPLTFREGSLDIPFTVPGFGLDSVQVMLVGRTFADLDDVRLIGPGNLTLTRDELTKDGAALIHVPVDRPGDWTLLLEGRKGDTVRLRLLYNADLQVNVSVSDENPCEVRAALTADGVTADSAEQYAGFQAEVMIMSADAGSAETAQPYRERMSLSPDGAGFVTTFAPSEMGTYRFAVKVSAPGELTVAEDAENVRSFPVEPCQFMSDWTEKTFEAPPPVDNPPRILQDPVKLTVKRGEALSADLREYVEDENPDTLSYALLSAPDGMETTLSRNLLTADAFNAPKGTFIISVTDEAGQSAELYVQVTAKAPPNPLLIVLLVLLAIAALIAACDYSIKNAPFYGPIEIMTEVNGVMSPRIYSLTPPKGSVRLSAFHIDNLESAFGPRAGRWVFTPLGRDCVTLRFFEEMRFSPPEVRGRNPSKVTIRSGQRVAAFSPNRPENRLIVQYKSKAASSGPRAPKPPKPPKPPKAPKPPKPPKF